MARTTVSPLTMAYGLAVLSMHASLVGDYELAGNLAGESLALFTNPLGVYLGQWTQSMAFVGLGQIEDAWQQARAALAYGRHWRREAFMIWPLPGVAIITALKGHEERGVEILSLYFNHPLKPSGWAESWLFLEKIRTELEESLGPDTFQESWQRGRELDLIAVVGALLDDGKDDS